VTIGTKDFTRSYLGQLYKARSSQGYTVNLKKNIGTEIIDTASPATRSTPNGVHG